VLPSASEVEKILLVRCLHGDLHRRHESRLGLRVGCRKVRSSGSLERSIFSIVNSIPQVRAALADLPDVLLARMPAERWRELARRGDAIGTKNGGKTWVDLDYIGHYFTR
jgi:hypothetical protein